MNLKKNGLIVLGLLLCALAGAGIEHLRLWFNAVPNEVTTLKEPAAQPIDGLVRPQTFVLGSNASARASEAMTQRVASAEQTGASLDTEPQNLILAKQADAPYVDGATPADRHSSDEQKTAVDLPDTVQNITFPNGNTVRVKTGVKVEVIEKKAGYPKARRIAIFVDNRAGAQLNENVLRFEDHVASRIGGDSFEVISKEDVVKALKVYPENGGPVFKALFDGERNAQGTKEDRKLTEDTSAVRLSQNIGADYLLMVALNSFNAETKHYKTADVDVVNKVYTLRGTYKLLDGVTGGTLGGLPVRASKTIRESANLSVENTDVTAELVEKLADAVAQDMLKKADAFREASAIGDIPVTIRCQVRDLQGHEISLNDVSVTEDNRIVIGTNALPLQVVANVAFDGMVMGTTPATLKVKPGPHKLRLTRPGFEDAEMTVKAVEGMDLAVTMQMSAEGFARWQQIRETLNALDVSRKLTDAEADRIHSIGQMFRQSGYRIDTKSDVRIDSKEVPAVNIHKSIL